VSNGYSQRKGLLPLVCALVFCWVFLAVWLGVACFVVFKLLVFGLALFGSVILFALYLSFFTRALIRDACSNYVFELTDMDAVLTVEDRLKHKRSTQMVLLNDIKYAEYYPYTDSACIIFHAPYMQMEVPLWPMGARSQDVLDFLNGRGVKVVNVQSDDEIPD
ncbi:MAG: hypothetical protein C5B53_02640, partial [Candidatus Melainabacteria bacterium]